MSKFKKNCGGGKMSDTLEKKVILDLGISLQTGGIEEQARRATRVINDQLSKMGKGARFDAFKKTAEWLEKVEQKANEVQNLLGFGKDNIHNVFGFENLDIDADAVAILGPIGEFINQYHHIQSQLYKLSETKKDTNEISRKDLAEKTNKLYKSIGMTEPLDIAKNFKGKAALGYDEAVSLIKNELSKLSEIKIDWSHILNKHEFDSFINTLIPSIQDKLKTIYNLINDANNLETNEHYAQSYDDIIDQIVRKKEDLAKSLGLKTDKEIIKLNNMISDEENFTGLWELADEDLNVEDLSDELYDSAKRICDNFLNSFEKAKNYAEHELNKAKEKSEDFENILQYNKDDENKTLYQLKNNINSDLAIIGDAIQQFGNKIQNVGSQSEIAAQNLNGLFIQLQQGVNNIVDEKLRSNSFDKDLKLTSKNEQILLNSDNTISKPNTSDAGYALDKTASAIHNVLGQILGVVQKFNFSDEFKNVITEIENGASRLDKLVSDIVNPQKLDASRYILESRPEIEHNLKNTISHVGGDDGIRVTKLDVDEKGLIYATGYVRTADKEWSDFNVTLARSGEVLNSNIESNKKLSREMSQEADTQKKFQKNLFKKRAELAAFFKDNPEAENESVFRAICDELNTEVESASDLSKWISEFKRETKKYYAEKNKTNKKTELDEIKKIVDSDYKSLKIDRYTDKDDFVGNKTVEQVRQHYHSIIDDINKALSGEIDVTDDWIESLNSRAKELRVITEQYKQQVAAAKTSSGALDVATIQKKAKAFYNSLDMSMYDNNAVISGESVETIKNAYDVVNKLSTKMKNGHILNEKENTNLREALSLLERISDAQSNIYGKKKYDISTLRYNNLIDQADIEFGTGSSIITEVKEKYTNAMDKVNKAWIALQSSPENTTMQFNFDEAIRDAQKLSKELETLITTTNKMKAASVDDPINITNYGDMSNMDRKYQLEQAVKVFSNGSAKIQKFNDDYTELTYTIKDGDGIIHNMVATFDKAGTSIVSLNNKISKNRNIFANAFDTIKSKAKNLLAFVGVDEFIHIFKQGISYVHQIDSAMTELKKVTDETVGAYEEFQDRVSKTAPSIASTPTEFISSTADWARLGLSLEDAEIMAKNTSILMNVSEFDNIEDATNSLVSSMQAYKYEAKDTMEIIDAFNSIGNNFAISTADAADSLTRSAAAMYAAGNDLNQTLALTAAANTFVQDPESVGNALKVLSMRIRGTKVELESAGEDTEGMAESTSKLRDQIMALTNISGTGGFDILQNNGDYKSTYDIIVGIADVWNEINDIDQAALLELIAGKQRGSIVAGLLENPELIKEAYDTASDSAGSAMVENEKYLNSIDGKIKILSSSFQTLWNNLLDDGVLKFFLDIANGAIKALDSIGPLTVALSGFLIYKQLFSDNKWDLTSMLFGKKNAQGTVENTGFFPWLGQKAKETTAWGYEKATGKKASWKVEVKAETKSAEESIARLEKKLSDLQEQRSKTTDKEILQRLDADIQATTQQIDALKNNINGAANGFDLLDKKVASIGKRKILELPDTKVLQEHIDAYNKLGSETERSEWFAKNIDKLTDAEAKYFSKIRGGTADVQSAKSAILQHNQAVQASGIKAKAAAIGHQLLNSALSFGVSLVLDGAISLFTSWINAADESAERARAAAETYSQAMDTFRSNARTITEIGSEYDTLAHGVDEFGNNISLSESEFEKYNDITNQIADMFPTLVDGWTEQGNAIVNLTNDVNGLTSATQVLNDENERQMKIERSNYLQSGVDIGNTLKKYYYGAGHHEYVDAIFETLETIPILNLFGQGNVLWTQADEAEIMIARSIAQGKKTLSALNEKEKMRLLNTFNSWGLTDQSGIDFGTGDTNGNLTAHLEYVFSKNSAQIVAMTESYSQEALKALCEFREVLVGYLEEDSTFTQLPESTQQIIKNYVNQIDVNDINDVLKDKDWNPLDFFNNALIDLSTVFDSTSVNSAVSGIEILKQQLEQDRISYKKYKEEYAVFLEQIQNDNQLTDQQKELASSVIDGVLNVDEKGIAIKQKVAQKYISELLNELDDSDYKTLLNDTFGGFLGKFEIDATKILPDIINVDNWTLGQLEQIYTSYEQVSAIAQDYKKRLQEDTFGATVNGDGNLQIGNVNVESIGSKNSNVGWHSEIVNESEYIIHYNAVFDGKEMSEDELDAYLDEIIQGADDATSVLERDAEGKGIIMKITPEFESIANEQEWSDDLHDIAAMYTHTLNSKSLVARILDSNAKSYSSLDSVSSYSALSSSADNYTSAVNVLNGQIFNNMKLTSEQQSILDSYLGSSAKYAEAVDKTNGCIVRNVDLLNEAIEAQRENDVATVRQARSQARLRYYELSKQLDAQIDNWDGVNSAIDDNIDATISQMDSLEGIISEYSMLEAALLGATNAYTKFSEAQEVDSETDYTSQYQSMIQVLADGFESGRVNTESFNAAIEALVPKDVIDGLDGYEKLQAVENYVSGTLGKYYTIDQDNVEVDTQSIQNFLDDAISQGVVITDAVTGNLTIAEGLGLDEAAEKLNVTKEVAYALFDELNNRNVYGGNLFDDLMEGSDEAEDKIWGYTQKIGDLRAERARLMSDNTGGQNQSSIDQIDTQIDDYNKKMQAETEVVIDQIKTAKENQKKIDQALDDGGVTLEAYKSWRDQGYSHEETQKMMGDKTSANFETLQSTYDQIQQWNKTIDEANSHSELTLTVAADQIDLETLSVKTKIQELNDFLADTSKTKTTIGGVEYNREQAQAEIDKLEKDLEELEKDKEILIDTSKVDTNVVKNDLVTMEEFTINDKIFKVILENYHPTLKQLDVLENGSDYERKIVLAGLEKNKSLLDEFQTILNSDGTVVYGLEGIDTKDLSTAQKIYKALETSSRKVDKDAQGYVDNTNELLDSLQKVTVNVDELSADEFNLEIQNLKEQLVQAGYDDDTIKEICDMLSHDMSTGLVEDLNSIEGPTEDAIALLGELGVQCKTVEQDGQMQLVVNGNQLDDALQRLGLTDQQISEIKSKWESTDISIDTRFTMWNADAVSEKAAELAKLPDNTACTYFNAQDNTSGIIASIRQKISQIEGNHTVTINGKVSGNTSWLGKNLLVGGSNSTGNAFASGSAHAYGNIGLPHAERQSLVGELGPELVVDPAKGIYKTVGDRGPEMIDLPKGSIIFNHLQTRDLLKNGSTKMRGTALATGNAYANSSIGLWNPSYKITNGNVNTDTSYVSNTSTKKTENALEDLLDSYSKLFDWIEIRLEKVSKATETKINNIDNYSHRLDTVYTKVAKGKGNYIYDTSTGRYISKSGGNYLKRRGSLEMIDVAVNQVKSEISTNEIARKKYLAQAAKIAKETGLTQYQLEGIQSGKLNISTYSENTQKKIQEYQKWFEKAQSCTDAIEQLNEQEKELYARRFEEIEQYYNNKQTTSEFKSNLLQTHMDWREAQGGPQSTAYYDQLIKNEQARKNLILEERNRMIKELNSQVSAGIITKGSNEWYELENKINDANIELQECNVTIEEFKNLIGEVHFENFDMLLGQFESLDSEIAHIYSLMTDKDIVEDDDYYKWTDNAITAIAMQAEALESAQYQARQYQEQIDYLNSNWKDLGYSESQYKEKLAELTEGQWQSVEAYEAAKDAIVEVNRMRIDAIKTGIQKEIDAYTKLINKRKEDLDAQKETHDWNESVEEQTKSIDKIQKQIDAISADTSMAGTAKRKQLLEELAEAQKELDNMMFDHNIDIQQDALDKDLESYQEAKDKEIEDLEEYLEDIDLVVKDSLNLVQAHTSDIMSTLQQLTTDYGLKLSSEIISPWKDGEKAIADYSSVFSAATSSFSKQLDVVSSNFQNLQEKADIYARYDIEYAADRDRTNSGYKNVPKVGATVQVQSDAAATWNDGEAIDKNLRNTNLTVVGVNADKNLVQLDIGKGKKKWINARYLYGYAKGTLGVSRSDFAVVDEDGYEELILHAGQNGRVEYLTKGTSVIPADITKNLMKIGQLDATEMMKRSIPTPPAPPIGTNNNMSITLDIAEVVHIEHADNSSIASIEQAVEAKLNNYMKAINQSMKKYIR